MASKTKGAIALALARILDARTSSLPLVQTLDGSALTSWTFQYAAVQLDNNVMFIHSVY